MSINYVAAMMFPVTFFIDPKQEKKRAKKNKSNLMVKVFRFYPYVCTFAPLHNALIVYGKQFFCYCCFCRILTIHWCVSIEISSLQLLWVATSRDRRKLSQEEKYFWLWCPIQRTLSSLFIHLTFVQLHI